MDRRSTLRQVNCIDSCWFRGTGIRDGGGVLISSDPMGAASSRESRVVIVMMNLVFSKEVLMRSFNLAQQVFTLGLYRA